jgi:predicted DNA-binding transcriptional regulator YafY
MAKGQHQRVKLMRVLDILRTETDEAHPISAARISAMLRESGVAAERKSIYEDIGALQAEGYDIIRTGRGFYLGERQFEAYELKLLCDAVQAAKFITKKKSDALIAKLSSFVSRNEGAMLSRQLYCSGEKAQNEEIFYNVDTLRSAIDSDNSVTFTYYEWNEKKEKVPRHSGALYHVSPWAMLWDDENYYLIAWDDSSKMVKHYRVDKMQRISVTDEKRLGRAEMDSMDLERYARSTFGMFGGDETAVTLECDNSLAGVIIDRFGTEVVLRNRGERFEVTVSVAVSPVFLSWAAGFGSRMRIVSPDDVVQRQRALLTDALDALNGRKK